MIIQTQRNNTAYDNIWPGTAQCPRAVFYLRDAFFIYKANYLYSLVDSMMAGPVRLGYFSLDDPAQCRVVVEVQRDIPFRESKPPWRHPQSSSEVQSSTGDLGSLDLPIRLPSSNIPITC
jgi:hypothetical protein